jgi:hypothetical protein
MFKPPLTYEDGRIIPEIANVQAWRVWRELQQAQAPSVRLWKVDSGGLKGKIFVSVVR